MSNRIPSSGLYKSKFEKDSCGFGLIAQMDDKASHWLLETAVHALARLTHRGAIAADGKSGDGCGLLIKKPDSFLRTLAAEAQIDLADIYASGLIFLNQDAGLAEAGKKELENQLGLLGLEIAGWREVPINPQACGEESLRTLPNIQQIFINAADGMDQDTLERKLYVARRRTEISLESSDDMFYVPSLSSRLMSYKGLVMPENLPVFYQDLNDPRLETSICVFHQRFSTNTWPQWRLAQPFRYLAHNGEINTIQGNRNWAKARAFKFHSDLLPELDSIRPLVNMSGSDSSSMDNMLEAMMAGGVSVFRAMRLLVPPAWQNIENMDGDLRAFYEYNSMHMEPWDGPAGIVLTDGRHACCTMDRNGLRPARYVITKDRHITLASEIGVYDYLPEDVVAKGRLKPGEMIAIDTELGNILYPEDIDILLKKAQPYAKWLKGNCNHLVSDLDEEPLTVSPMSKDRLKIYEKQFLVSFEERDQVIRVLAESGQEAVGSMGDDTPFPVLSTQQRSLFDYFRQQFAQVTNPPIDSIREAVVMSLETCLGKERNLFQESAEHANRLIISSPVMSEGK
ncbi:MAG: glutamate synthase central domain-containing protein, partial [Gammaproteobacteria bacterium]